MKNCIFLTVFTPWGLGWASYSATAQNPKVGASPELKIHQKSIKEVQVLVASRAGVPHAIIPRALPRGIARGLAPMQCSGGARSSIFLDSAAVLREWLWNRHPERGKNPSKTIELRVPTTEIRVPTTEIRVQTTEQVYENAKQVYKYPIQVLNIPI